MSRWKKKVLHTFRRRSPFPFASRLRASCRFESATIYHFLSIYHLMLLDILIWSEDECEVHFGTSNTSGSSNAHAPADGEDLRPFRQGREHSAQETLSRKGRSLRLANVWWWKVSYARLSLLEFENRCYYVTIEFATIELIKIGERACSCLSTICLFFSNRSLVTK